MTATNGRAMKAKGSAWERAVVAFLRASGHPHAERCYGAGRQDDRGDIDGLPGVVIECKAHRAMDLAGWMDEAVHEASHGGCLPVVVAKRRGKPTGDAYVVMRLGDWSALMAEET